jgi:RNA polymerase sigma factor (sigma-70 family)
MAPGQFAAYVEANYDHFLHFVQRHGPSADEAHDLLHAALLRLWVNCERIDPEHAAAYFFRALRNRINDAWSRRASRPFIREVEEGSALAPPRGPADRALEQWLVGTLRRVKEGMTESQRLALACCWRAYGDRQQALSWMNGKGADAYDGALHRARIRLREALLPRREELRESVGAERLWELVFAVFCTEGDREGS